MIKNIASTLCFLALALLAVGCKCGRPAGVHELDKGLSVVTPVGSANPYGYGPTDNTYPWKGLKPIADGMNLIGGRTAFQTRDMISITVSSEVFIDATSFSLYNATPEETGEPPIIILEDEAVELGASLRFALYKLADGENMLLRLFPGEEGWEGKFIYGWNILTLVVDDLPVPQYSTIELFLKDFDVSGLAVTAFADDVQVYKEEGPDGFQAQGWMNVYGTPNATDPVSETKLTTGLFNVVNPE